MGSYFPTSAGNPWRAPAGPPILYKGKNSGGGGGGVDPNTGQPAAGWGGGTVKNAPLPYNNSKVLAQHAYHQAMDLLAQQKGDTLAYYGYQKGKNGYKLDPNATYGAFQMMSRDQGQQLNDLANAQQQSGLVGFGQRGTRGLAAQQRNTALFAQGYEQTQLLKEFQDKMDAIRLGQREAKWAHKHDELSGTLQSILSAIAGGQFTPAAPAY